MFLCIPYMIIYLFVSTNNHYTVGFLVSSWSRWLNKPGVFCAQDQRNLNQFWWQSEVVNHIKILTFEFDPKNKLSQKIVFKMFLNIQMYGDVWQKVFIIWEFLLYVILQEQSDKINRYNYFWKQTFCGQFIIIFS